MASMKKAIKRSFIPANPVSNYDDEYDDTYDDVAVGANDVDSLDELWEMKQAVKKKTTKMKC